jgi:drug/metabolite transporter (DMT)-like permease
MRVRRPSRRVAVGHFFSSSTISYSASTALARLVSSALWQLALQYAENTAKVSNLIFIAPFCSLVLIHFALGEQILWSTVVGLLFIVAGLLYQQFGARTHSTDP